MAEQQLIDYIRTSQQGGVSFDDIKRELLSAGWNQNQIDDAFRAINVPKPPTPIPVPAPLTTKSFTPRKIYTTPYSVMLSLVLVVSLLILTQNAVTDILNRFTPSPDNYFSSKEYAKYEAERIVMVKEFSRTKPKESEYPDRSSFILARNSWEAEKFPEERSLAQKYEALYKARASSPSSRMLLNAIIVLPFWIITFLLFVSVKEERKKYGVLLWSYYVTSGWLLIFLFFNVARYIWTSNTVIGVYVVLGMLVLILTGAVWGVQKYRHSIE